MKRLVWETERDDGKTYRIEFADYFKSGASAQYWYRSLDGNIGQGSAQTVKPPDRDGAVTYQVTGSQREVTFEGTLVARSGDRMSESRIYLCKCFDPRYFGVFCITTPIVAMRAKRYGADRQLCPCSTGTAEALLSSR